MVARGTRAGPSNFGDVDVVVSTYGTGGDRGAIVLLLLLKAGAAVEMLWLGVLWKDVLGGH